MVGKKRLTQPAGQITQHVFCPIFTQRRVAK